MKKPPSPKRQAVKELQFWIHQTRKLARQINRKLESMARANKMKAAAKERLIKICLPE